MAGVGGVRSSVVSFLPSLWIIMLWNCYNRPLKELIALFFSLLFSVVYFGLGLQGRTIKIALFSVMFAALYFLAAGASYIFVVLVVIFELSSGGRLVAAANILIASLATYLIGVSLSGLDVRHAYFNLFEVFPLGAHFRTVSLLYLYLFYPAVFLFWGLRRKLISRDNREYKNRQGRKQKELTNQKSRAVFANEWLRFAFSLLVLFGISAGGVICSFDSDSKNILVMNSMVRQERWEDYLKAVKVFEKGGEYNPQISHDANLALYKLGRLSDEMFSYMQDKDALLLFEAEGLKSSAKYLRVLDICYELGSMNSAERWAYEILETQGWSPIIISRLANICIVKKQIAAARVFLASLSKDLIWGNYARQRLIDLEEGPSLASDSRVQLLRTFNRQKNIAFNSMANEDFLLSLLEGNPANRMAFEYLMAFYLLKHDQESFIANLYRLDDMGYERIPTHWEEGILIYSSKTQKPVNLYGRQMSDDTQERLKNYLAVFKACKSRKDAYSALAPQFGNSYFFYSMFTVSGLGR